MRYVKFTHIDRRTKISAFEEPTKYGPEMPAGYTFDFALESLYPVDVPTFYGYVEDDSIIIPTSFEVITKSDFDSIKLQEMKDRLAILKASKIEQIRTSFNSYSEKPRVQTELGFAVDGGYTNLQDFTYGKDLGFLYIRDADNQMHEVTLEQMDIIITSIKTNGIRVYQKKWILEQEVGAVNITSVTEYASAVQTLNSINITYEPEVTP